jgi:pSer/pThr/pTyr-binding forkhead associated (FHA) protein
VTTETSYLEVSKPGGLEVVLLGRENVTIGRSACNDVVIEYDLTVSSLHAVIECYAGGWTIRDLGSRNGTVLEGERLLSERTLRHGDELRVGHTRITFRSHSAPAIPCHTEQTGAPHQA